jgi:HEAT repeat protein
MLSAESIAAGAVAGVGEVGRPDDSGLLLPLLSVTSPRVRAEAVRALRRLGQATPDLPALRELVGAGDQQHTRTAAYRLLRVRDIYVRLAVDLQLLNDRSTELAGRAKADIHDWLTRVAPTAYEPLSGSIRDELDARLNEERSLLGASMTRALRFHLRLTATGWTRCVSGSNTADRASYAAMST